MNNSIWNITRIALILAISMTFVACNKKKGSADEASTPTPSVTPEPPPVSDEAPMAITISSIWDKSEDQAVTTWKTCTATKTDPDINCDVNIPEGQLFYSKMIIQLSFMRQYCEETFFQPYYYRASASAGFFPQWSMSTDPIDCSGASSVPTAECYNGIAALIVPSFPLFTGFYIPPDISKTGPTSADWTVPSAWASARRSNRFLVSDLANPVPALTSAQLPFGTAAANYNAARPDLVATSIGDSYIAGTLVKNVFSCRNRYDDDRIYYIRLNFQKVNSDPNESNYVTRPTWNYE